MKWEQLNRQLLERLRRLRLQTRQTRGGSVSGIHRNRNLGKASEFAEYRNYVLGDDIRRLDWKTYARSDRFYLKEYESETNLNIFFVLDVSGSMGFVGKTKESKYERACSLVAHLTWLALQQRDEVGLCFSQETANSEHSLPISKSGKPSQLIRILDSMRHHAPGGKTVLTKTLHELVAHIPQRSFVCIFSDLYLPENELHQALAHLAFRRHEMAIFHMIEPNEIGLPITERTCFENMETKRRFIADPEEAAEDYRKNISNYLSRMEEYCRTRHIDYRRISSEETDEDILTEFLLRSHRIRRA